MTGSRLTWIVSGVFIGLFLLLVLSVAWIPDLLSAASPVRLTWGQLLMILIHVFSVIAAWIYVVIRGGE